MADLIVPASPDVARPWNWLTFYVTPETLTGTVDVTVATLPAGTVVYDARMVVIAADVGATSSAADLEMGASPGTANTLLDGGADFGGTVGVTVGGAATTVVDATLSAINLVSLGGTDLVVNLEITFVGAATTAPTYLVAICCGRNDY